MLTYIRICNYMYIWENIRKMSGRNIPEENVLDAIYMVSQLWMYNCPVRWYTVIIIIIINQRTNARRCPMPFSLFDAIFVSPKQRGIVLVLMHHTSLLYCPSILYVVALFC